MRTRRPLRLKTFTRDSVKQATLSDCVHVTVTCKRRNGSFGPCSRWPSASDTERTISLRPGLPGSPERFASLKGASCSAILLGWLAF